MSSPAYRHTTHFSDTANTAGNRRALGAMRVLLVEDDPVQSDLLAAALHHYGVGYLSLAESGWTALAHLAAAPYDLVISDLQLPGMDGVEFLHRAASFDIGAFAIVSGADATIMSTIEHALAERGARVLGRLAKPLLLEDVAHLLDQCCTALAPCATALPLAAPARLATLAQLRDALQAGQFVPYYQPKVSLVTGQLLGVEVLARWRQPDGTVATPDQFIETMEDNPLIDQLTYALLEQVLVDAAHWDDITIALNLVPHTLEDPGLPDRLLAMVRSHGVAPGRITLELTETAMARNPQLVRDCAARLRLRGFRFAVDDFGIGYSSMALLLSLPFTELKIDRSFVSSLTGSIKARTMLEAMVALGNRLDMQVVAEGIEHESELKLLRSIGCPAGQGYLFAAPMDQQALLQWMAVPRPAPRQPAALH